MYWEILLSIKKLTDVKYTPPETSLLVSADAFQIIQASQAPKQCIKYLLKGQTILLNLKGDKTTLQIAAQDKGNNICTDEIENIFDEYVQSSQTKFGTEELIGTFYLALSCHRTSSPHMETHCPHSRTVLTIALPRVTPPILLPLIN